jgi:hypothetical protein
MRAVDIRVVRIVDEDLDSGWGDTEDRLRSLLAVPGPAVRRFTTAVRSRGVVRAG